MANRKQFHTDLPVTPELAELLRTAQAISVSEDELREQRVSFAFGNAPHTSDLITKESVRMSSQHVRLQK